MDIKNNSFEKWVLFIYSIAAYLKSHKHTRDSAHRQTLMPETILRQLDYSIIGSS